MYVCIKCLMPICLCPIFIFLVRFEPLVYYGRRCNLVQRFLAKKGKDPLRKDEYKHTHFISESLKYGNREERKETCGTRMQHYFFFFLLVLMILKNSHLR